ncbi:hypothetical protein BDZ45DRAFT_753974 [Acephala macrosclerotiorum]|nr:hypothetical protein BDZ45DRAFT_753974 [Acephala macrosclerotiorum]
MFRWLSLDLADSILFPERNKSIDLEYAYFGKPNGFLERDASIHVVHPDGLDSGALPSPDSGRTAQKFPVKLPFEWHHTSKGLFTKRKNKHQNLWCLSHEPSSSEMESLMPRKPEGSRLSGRLPALFLAMPCRARADPKTIAIDSNLLKAWEVNMAAPLKFFILGTYHRIMMYERSQNMEN